MHAAKTLLLCLALALTSFTASAQSNTGTSVEAQKAQVSAQEPYIYERVESNLRYERDGTGVREVRARIRVQTAAGLQNAGQLVFDYNAENERVDIRNIRVTKQDGSVVTAGPDAVQDLSSPVAQQAPVYTDARQKHVTVPGVDVGSIVEYDVVTTTFQPLLQNQFWQTLNLVSDVSCLDEEVDLNVPRDRPLKMKSPEGVNPSIREEGERRIYHWTTSSVGHQLAAPQIPQFKFDPATLLRGDQHPLPRQILFSTLQSWSEVGLWYAGLERERRAVTPEIRARAEEITKNKKTDRERGEALYEWVSRNIRYVSLSFGIGRYQPHKAEEVLSNRYGDCKDKTTLLESLYDAAGLNAQAVLINSRADVDPAVPSPLQFDHAINLVRLDGQEHWLDSTLGVGPFDYLLPQLRDKNALVIFTASEPSLKKSPAALPIPILYRFDAKGHVDKDKNIELAIDFTTRGDLEVLARSMALRFPPAQMNTLIQRGFEEQIKKQKSKDMALGEFTASDPMDIQYPFRASIQLRGKASSDDSKKADVEEVAGNLGSGLDANMVLALLPGVESHSKKNVYDQDAVKLGGPKEYVLNVEITAASPPNTTFRPVRVSILKDFAEYEANFNWDGSALHILWRLDLKVSEVPKSKAQDYAAFVQQVSESFDEIPLIKKRKAKSSGVSAPGAKNSSGSTAPGNGAAPKTSPASAPVHKPPSDAVAAYDKGQAEVNRKNWANAEEEFLAALKIDPEYARAWANLGRTRMYLRKTAEAETNFRKCLDLVPDYAFCYSQLAWSLMVQKKYVEAASMLESRIASAPGDADAHHRLALAYRSLQQPDRAVQEMEKAVELQPKNPAGHFDLGLVYLDVHENDKAAAAFNSALNMNESESYLNNAAYVLSQHKTHLEIAESWSLKSIEKVELELDQASISQITPRVTSLVSSLAMFWDTLAWIKFQQQDYAAAEKYQKAAWILADDPVMGLHMGHIYEEQKQMDAAMDAYAMALAAISDPAQFKDEQIEAHSHLVAFLQSESAATERVAKFSSGLKQRRTTPVANVAKAEGIAQYLVIIGPDSRVAEMEAVNPDDSLVGLRDAVRAVTLPVSFPDDKLKKLPGSAVLSCPSSDQPCVFTLLSTGASARMLRSSSSGTAPE